MKETNRAIVSWMGFAIWGVLALSVLTAGGLWFFRGHKQAHDRMAADELIAVAAQKKSQLSAWVQDQKDDALALQKSLFFMTHAAAALEDPESPLSPYFEKFLRLVFETWEGPPTGVGCRLDVRPKMPLGGPPEKMGKGAARGRG